MTDFTTKKPLNVFISYSRVDQMLAGEVCARLNKNGIRTTIDTIDIVKGEPWKDRLKALIENSVAVVAIVSKNSLASDHCQWEIYQTLEFGKRIIPIVFTSLDEIKLPTELARLNITSLEMHLDDETEISKLVSAIVMDPQWNREHSRIGELARRWDRYDRPRRLLLRGDEIKKAEKWLSTNPTSDVRITKIHQEFIQNSRNFHKMLRKYSILFFAIILSSLCALSYLYYNQLEVSDHNSVIATNRESLALANYSEIAYRGDKPLLSLKLAFAAWPRTNDDIRPKTKEAWSIFSKILPDISESYRFGGGKKAKTGAVYDASRNRVILWHADRGIRSISVADGVEVWQSNRWWDSAIYLQISSNNEYVSILSSDGTVRILKASDGTEVLLMPTESQKIVQVAFNPEGKELLLIENSGLIISLDIQTGATNYQIDAWKGMEPKVSYFDDSKLFVVWTYEESGSRLYDGTNQKKFVFIGNHSGYNPPVFTHGKTRVFVNSKDSTDKYSNEDWQLKVIGTQEAIKKYYGDESFENIYKAPKGNRIITESLDNKIILRNGFTGDPIAPINGHSDTPYNFIFSDDGSKVISFSSDSTARVWNANTGKIMFVLKGHASPVISGTFSQDGLQIATWSENKSIILWDAQTGNQNSVLRGHDDTILDLKFINNGKSILSWSHDGTIRIWDAHKTLRITRKLCSENFCDGQTVTGLFIPKSRFLATWSHTDGMNEIRRHSIDFYNVNSGKLIKTLEGHTANINGALSYKEGKRLLSWSDDGTIRLWNAVNGTLLSIFLEHQKSSKHRGRVMGAIFVEDYRKVLSWSLNGLILLWDVDSGEVLKSYHGPSGQPRLIRYNSKSKRLVTNHDDKTLRLWNTESEKEISILQTNVLYTFVEMNNDGSRLIAYGNSDNNDITLWDTKDGSRVRGLKLSGQPIRGAGFIQGSILAADSKLLRQWSSKTGLFEHEFEIEGNIFRLKVSEEGLNFALLTDKSVEIRSLSKKKWSTPLHLGNIGASGVKFFENSSKVISWYYGGKIIVWDTKTGLMLSRLNSSRNLIDSILMNKSGEYAYVISGGEAVDHPVADEVATHYPNGQLWRISKTSDQVFEMLCKVLPDHNLNSISKNHSIVVSDPICKSPNGIPLPD